MVNRDLFNQQGANQAQSFERHVRNQLAGDPLPGTGEAEKAKALEQVKENSGPWFEKARAVALEGLFREFCPHGGHMGHAWPATGEDIRVYLGHFAGKPHHPNAWGALVARLVKDGILEPTGRYVAMVTKSSHARRTPEYRPGPRALGDEAWDRVIDKYRSRP